MTCPKCGAEPKEFWYDGSCIEHGRPEPVEGRYYWVKFDNQDIGSRWFCARRGPGFWRDDRGTFEDIEVTNWLPIPTVEELLLTTKGKI